MRIKLFKIPRGQMELLTANERNELTMNDYVSCRIDRVVESVNGVSNQKKEFYYNNYSNTSDLRLKSGNTMVIPSDKFIEDFGEM